MLTTGPSASSMAEAAPARSGGRSPKMWLNRSSQPSNWAAPSRSWPNRSGSRRRIEPRRRQGRLIAEGRQAGSSDTEGQAGNLINRSGLREPRRRSVSRSTASIPPTCGAAPRARPPAGWSSTWAKSSRSVRSASGTTTTPGIPIRAFARWISRSGRRKPAGRRSRTIWRSSRPRAATTTMSRRSSSSTASRPRRSVSTIWPISATPTASA